MGATQRCEPEIFKTKKKTFIIFCCLLCFLPTHTNTIVSYSQMVYKHTTGLRCQLLCHTHTCLDKNVSTLSLHLCF